MPPAPTVSVIIPVHNGETYLREAIESILHQDYPAIELIVIDDGSTDGTAAIIRSFANRLIHEHQQNQGHAAALNRGIALARGEFLAFLDADDLWLPGKLSRQLSLLQAHPDISMVFTLMEMFHSPELSPEQRKALQGDGDVLPGYSICTLLVSKSNLLKVGLFAPQFRMGDFIDWYLRAQEAGLSHLLLQETLVKRRLHGNNMSIKDKDKRRQYLKVLKDSLDRRGKS